MPSLRDQPAVARRLLIERRAEVAHMLAVVEEAASTVEADPQRVGPGVVRVVGDLLDPH